VGPDKELILLLELDGGCKVEGDGLQSKSVPLDDEGSQLEALLQARKMTFPFCISERAGPSLLMMKRSAGNSHGRGFFSSLKPECILP
jgi:hypothetical protein